MPSLHSLVYLLTSAACLVSGSPTKFHDRGVASLVAQRTGPALCHSTIPFFCPLGDTTATDFRFNYDALTFGPVPPGTTGNPATNKFCLNQDCDPYGTISIEIDGNNCDTIGESDPVVIIRFPTILGYTYTEEHIFVGPDQSTIPNNPGSYPFKTPTYCTANISPATCTISLKKFLEAGGVTGCSDDAEHTFNIVTHAALKDSRGNSASGTSTGTCISGLNAAMKCAPWFAFGTITSQCTKCTLCNTCACPDYADAHKCECNQEYATAHACECAPNTCACSTYATGHPCECTPNTCACSTYATGHPCECAPNTCACSDYATAHPCECAPNTCECSTYATEHACECAPNTCACSTYATGNPCECAPNTCACSTYSTGNPCECAPNTCACSDYATAHACECAPTTCACSTFADAHKCECNPDCTCQDYANSHPDTCFHWCPDVDTAYGYFDNTPSYQAQFNKPNYYLKRLSNKNCQSKWGWWDTFTSSQLVDGSTYTGRLVSGAGNYNLAASYTAGTFTLTVASGGQLQFSFISASGDIQFDIFHVQAGCDIPTTCAPGQFNNKYTRTLGSPSASSDSGLSITLPSGCTTTSTYVYFIFHAAVAKRIPISQSCSGAAPQ